MKQDGRKKMKWIAKSKNSGVTGMTEWRWWPLKQQRVESVSMAYLVLMMLLSFLLKIRKSCENQIFLVLNKSRLMHRLLSGKVIATGDWNVGSNPYFTRLAAISPNVEIAQWFATQFGALMVWFGISEGKDHPSKDINKRVFNRINIGKESFRR